MNCYYYPIFFGGPRDRQLFTIPPEDRGRPICVPVLKDPGYIVPQEPSASDAISFSQLIYTPRRMIAFGRTILFYAIDGLSDGDACGCLTDYMLEQIGVLPHP